MKAMLILSKIKSLSWRKLIVTWQHYLQSCFNHNVLYVWMTIINCMRRKCMKKTLSYKIYESLDQVNSKLTAVEGGVVSGIRLINDENFYACINGENAEKMGLFSTKFSLMIRKDIGNGTSGVPELRFITLIQIDLYLVTKKCWLYQYQIILYFIQWWVRKNQINHLQFFAKAGRWGILMITSKSLCLSQNEDIFNNIIV